LLYFASEMAVDLGLFAERRERGSGTVVVGRSCHHSSRSIWRRNDKLRPAGFGREKEENARAMSEANKVKAQGH